MRTPTHTHHDDLLPDPGERLPTLGVLPAFHLGNLGGTSAHHDHSPTTAVSRRAEAKHGGGV